MQNKKLRGGYTTGVHTSYAFKSALGTYIAYNELSISKTIKMQNDDLDVTKGCEIIVSISSKVEDLVLNDIKQKPYILNCNNTTVYIDASSVVGIVTKKGLKPPPQYPAINPVPLNAIKDVFESLSLKINKKELFCSVGVTNGVEIAKQTANAKVGILGGISNGDDIVLNVYFKPTPSIFKEQHTITTDDEEVDFSLKGRHDPCVAIRGSVVCESMAALVIADMLLLNMTRTMENIKRVYN